MLHEIYMREALKEANKAYRKREVPVGAVAVAKGKIIARGHNKRETWIDPTAHAEIICLQKAAQSLGGWRLENVTLYSTVEPCPMCAGALVLARIKHLVYGADDPKAGAVGSQMNILEHRLLNHKVKVTRNILKEECKEILQQFFKELRKRRGVRVV